MTLHSHDQKWAFKLMKTLALNFLIMTYYHQSRNLFTNLPYNAKGTQTHTTYAWNILIDAKFASGTQQIHFVFQVLNMHF